jgi:hypothetical protein
MNRGTLIALGLGFGTLALVYTQRKKTDEAARDGRAQIPAGGGFPEQGGPAPVDVSNLPPELIPVVLGLEGQANGLEATNPEAAAALRAQAASIRAAAASAASRPPLPIDRARILIAKAKRDVASITSAEASEMEQLANTLPPAAYAFEIDSLRTMLRIRDAFFQSRGGPLQPPPPACPGGMTVGPDGRTCVCPDGMPPGPDGTCFRF